VSARQARRARGAGVLARVALGLYPPAWRARYGDEVRALLEDSGAGVRVAVSLTWHAVPAWAWPTRHLHDRPGRMRAAWPRREWRGRCWPGWRPSSCSWPRPRIEVTGLRKRFGRTVALDGMSFTVLPGQVTGFVGPNGAGNPVTELRLLLPPGHSGGGVGRLTAVPCHAEEIILHGYGPLAPDYEAEGDEPTHRERQVIVGRDRKSHVTARTPAALPSLTGRHGCWFLLVRRHAGHGSHLLGHGVRDLLQPRAAIGRDLDVVL
jgi:hypothetical protein